MGNNKNLIGRWIGLALALAHSLRTGQSLATVLSDSPCRSNDVEDALWERVTRFVFMRVVVVMAMRDSNKYLTNRIYYTHNYLFCWRCVQQTINAGDYSYNSLRIAQWKAHPDELTRYCIFNEFFFGGSLYGWLRFSHDPENVHWIIRLINFENSTERKNETFRFDWIVKWWNIRSMASSSTSSRHSNLCRVYLFTFCRRIERKRKQILC